jgi:dynein heavy chain
MNLFAGVDPLVPVDKKGRLNPPGGDPWKCKDAQFKNPQDFLNKLKEFKGEIEAGKVPKQNFDAIKPTLENEDFTKEKIINASECCGNLCDWVKNIDTFYHIFMNVEPKKLAAEQAEKDLEAANTKKAAMIQKVEELTAALKILEDQFKQVMDDKEAAEAEAERCASKLDLAQRLVNALGSESTRWAQAIVDAETALTLIIGDVLMASAFVSYVGPFAKKYRDQIMGDKFMKFFIDNKIPMTEGKTVLDILTTPAMVAKWNTEKLPPDSVSIENGAILSNSARYSLIIDPQLQGITWLKEKEKDSNLQVTRLTNPKIVRTVETAVEQGQPVLIENLFDTIDAVLQPVYARAIIKKGRTRYIKMGDKELSLHNNFNLYLHTKLSNPHYQPEI